MKQSIAIIEDEKSDDPTAKYAVDGFKKCFVCQLTDRKVAVHKGSLNMINSMIKSRTKAFKKQTPHYLKNTLQFLEKCPPKSCSSAESTIKLIIKTCTVKDNKQLGVIVAELIRVGSSAKNKSSRKNGWMFVNVVLEKYEPKKGGKKLKKPPKAVLDVLQTGLKQGLSDSDKATQKEAMQVLTKVSLIDETRAERITQRMTPAAKRHFDQLFGSPSNKPKKKKPRTPRTPKTPKTPKTPSKTPRSPKKGAKTNGSKKTGSKKNLTAKDKSKKGGTKKSDGKKKGGTKSSDTKNKKTNKTDKSKKEENKSTKTDKSTKKDDDRKSGDEQSKTVETPKDDDKTVSNGNYDKNKNETQQTTTNEPKISESTTTEAHVKAVEETETTETPSTTTTATAGTEKKDDKDTTTTDNTESNGTAKTSTDGGNEEEEQDGDGDGDDKGHHHSRKVPSLLGDNDPEQIAAALHIPIPDDGDGDEATYFPTDKGASKSPKDDDEDGDGDDDEDSDDDEDEDSDDEDDDDDDSNSDDDDSQFGGGGSSSENDARDLIESFLDLKDPQINWKMIEFLSKDNMTHLLMSYISRMPQGPKIWQENLDVNFDEIIPETLPLYSDEADEIRATQLSYSLMRILSNEHAAETVKSFLLRKCQEICLHALAVFHPLSKGNVYHGRVVLEILLNHWPKSFMAALANQRHIQSLLKCALFRNLHQGNLNSFFLDLICFRPTNKIGQIQ
eukprot:531717_1